MTKKLIALTLLAVAGAARPVAAQAIVLLILGNGINSEQGEARFLLTGVDREENACRYASFTATAYDPNGIADPIERFVELNPPLPVVVNMSFGMNGFPDSARVVTISDSQQVGQCNLEIVGVLKDALGRTVGVQPGHKVLFAGHVGEEGPVGPPRGPGVIVGNAALGERAVFGFLRATKPDAETLDLVSADVRPEPCQSLSFRFTAFGAAGHGDPMEVDVDLDPQQSFASVEVPLADFGGDPVLFEITLANEVPQGRCSLIGSYRVTDSSRNTATFPPNTGSGWYSLATGNWGR